MTRAELRASCPRNDTGDYIEWLETQVLALTADEEPRQAAERIVQSHLDNSKLTDEDLRTQITTAIQAAVEAEREHGRKALEEAKAETVAALADAIESSMECSEIDHVAHVAQFMAKFGQHIGEAPGFPPQDVLDLRVKLIAEECCEMLKAGGYEVDLTVRRGMYRMGQFQYGLAIVQYAHSFPDEPKPDFPAFIDALLDLEYVILGTHVSCGVDPQPIWEAVHASNMAKQPAADPFTRCIKPAGWVEPDIAGALKDQGWQA